jgi:phospholipid/cholesterol/gamma-HCH transport system ATP-binding protein
MIEPLIELKGVSKSFGNNIILDKVDLTIYRGEALGIIGPSGTGKSTILRIIAGLTAPDEGEIYVAGQQRQGLIEDAEDPIGIGLEMVGLPGIGKRYPSELSGGMRKRVSFARAIIANPDNIKDNPQVLLYDEPTAGLDPIASTVIEDLVRQLQCVEGGCASYVMVTHQDSTIRRTADRIVFLYKGKIQWQGKVSEIDTTDNPLVRQFFSASTTGPIQVIG